MQSLSGRRASRRLLPDRSNSAPAKAAKPEADASFQAPAEDLRRWAASSRKVGRTTEGKREGKREGRNGNKPRTGEGKRADEKRRRDVDKLRSAGFLVMGGPICGSKMMDYHRETVDFEAILR